MALAWSATMTPDEHARDLRRRAESACPADRHYLLWLAHEWDLTAERDHARRYEPSRPVNGRDIVHPAEVRTWRGADLG
jgi:hypothetical protein